MSELVSDLDIPRKINNPLLISDPNSPSMSTDAFETLWTKALKNQSELVGLVDEVDVLSFFDEETESLASFDEFFFTELDAESDDVESFSLPTESVALPDELPFFP